MILKYHNLYNKSFRKNYTPWVLSANLYNTFSKKTYTEINPFFLRSKLILNKLILKNYISIKYNWVLIFKKKKNIKK